MRKHIGMLPCLTLVMDRSSIPLTTYSAAGTRAEQLAQLDTLISAWAATAELGTLQSRAAENGYTLKLSMNIISPTELAALEAFNGRGYFRMPWEGASYGESALQGMTVGEVTWHSSRYWNDNTQSWVTTYYSVYHPEIINAVLWPAHTNSLDKAYDALRESVYQALLPHTRLKPYLDAIGLTIDANGIQLDFSAVKTAFEEQAVLNPEKAVDDLIEFNRYGKDLFKNTSWETDSSQLLSGAGNGLYGFHAANDGVFEVRRIA